MKRAYICTCSIFLGLFILCLFSFLYIRSPGGVGSQGAVQPQGDPVRIGVCMPSSGSLADTARDQAEGIKKACQMGEGTMSRQVQLILKDAGQTPQDFRHVLQGLVMDEKVSGIIACVSPDTVLAANDIILQGPVAVVVTSSGGPLRWAREVPAVLRLSVSLEDQATACSRFMANVLSARRVGIIVDTGDATCVQLGSLFSSDVVSLGVTIVDIAYVKKGEDPSGALTHLMRAKPDAVYVPYSGTNILQVVIKARAIDNLKPIVMSNVEGDESLLAASGTSLDGVYLLSDFMEEHVKSTRGKEFIEYYQKHPGKSHHLGSATATGAEAFFLLLDMISRSESKGRHEFITQGAPWQGLLIAMTGLAPSGALRTHLYFGRIKNRFFGKATLRYVATVAVSRSDPLTDVGTQ